MVSAVDGADTRAGKPATRERRQVREPAPVPPRYGAGWVFRQVPPDIVDATRARYIEAYERISGLQFSDWIKP